MGPMSTQPMKVDNTAFLLEKLAADCSPLQYVRELTENAVQAITERRNRGWNGEGFVYWDVDWRLVEGRNNPVYKLQVSDNGTGMTGPEIQKYINHLAASAREQDVTKNFGVGAKITACVKNPHGLIYKSWVDGSGVYARLFKDDEIGYGLQQLELPSGDFEHFAPLSDEAKSEPITDDTCGTSVVLMGKKEDDDTYLPPEANNKWLIKYLNDRYFEFPSYVKVQVRNFSKTNREGWPKSRSQGMGEEGSQMRTIKGMRNYLNEFSAKKGLVELSTATIHWWIFPEDGVRQTDIWESTGHCAALYQRELYEFTKGNSFKARIRDFGIYLGEKRVVLYAEPNTQKLKVTANTARSDLVIEGQKLPWTEWAAEFRARIPEEITQMMEELSARSSGEDNSENNKKRLKEIEELLKYSNYKPSPLGKHEIGGQATGGQPGDKKLGHAGGSGSGDAGGSKGNPYADLIKGSDKKGEPVNNDPYPKIHWVSTHTGTRDNGDLEDRAGEYQLDNNVLKLNEDFRGFQTLIKHFATIYNIAESEGAEGQVTRIIKSLIELQAVEVVYAIRSMRGNKEWDSESIKAALSPEALTACLSMRFALASSIRKTLSQRLGKQPAS
jgi:hypothetical protein